MARRPRGARRGRQAPDRPQRHRAGLDGLRQHHRGAPGGRALPGVARGRGRAPPRRALHPQVALHHLVPWPRPLLHGAGLRPRRRGRRHAVPGRRRVAHQRVGGRRVRGRRRRAAVDRRAAGHAGARGGAAVVDGLPPPHRRRHPLQRRHQRPDVPARPADIQRAGAGRHHRLRRDSDVLQGAQPGPVPCGSGRAGPVRRDRPRSHRARAGAGEGAVGAPRLHRLRHLLRRPAPARRPPAGRRVRADELRRGVGLREPQPSRGAEERGVLLRRRRREDRRARRGQERHRRVQHRGDPELRRQRHRRVVLRCGGPGARVGAGGAELRGGARVRARRVLRGVPRPGAWRGGGARQGRAVARPAPVAQPVRAALPHRRLRPRRLQGHPPGHRHRRASRRVPGQQIQVGRRHVGGDAGGGGDLLRGVAALLVGGERPEAAGGAKPKNCAVLRPRRDRVQSLPGALHEPRRLGPALRRQVGSLRGDEGQVRPQEAALPRPRHLQLINHNF